MQCVCNDVGLKKVVAVETVVEGQIQDTFWR